ncbi:uncharacterized protein LOC130710102 [Lotus japonicus]|uniref:uncharacterized protein LOC130710102 n=1 Tax=Lotus japonicus TaxID=34305 RepID=UPI00258EDB09|nr:uncharacterized protein LOC130710102 [Lotus japonicus]
MRKDKILKAFEDNCILEKLAATSEELQNDVVMEAMQKAPSGFPHWHKLNLIAERETRKHQVILAHKEIKEMIYFIQDDLMMIKQVLQPTMQPSPQTINYTCEDEANTWCDDNRSSPKDHDECHIEEQNHQVRSNIYTRLKDQPRKRIESAVTRSPWTTYQRRRNKGKEVKVGNL